MLLASTAFAGPYRTAIIDGVIGSSEEFTLPVPVGRAVAITDFSDGNGSGQIFVEINGTKTRILVARVSSNAPTSKDIVIAGPAIITANLESAQKAILTYRILAN